MATKVVISIASDNELVYTEGEESESRIVDTETLSDDYWTWPFLLEIAAYCSVSKVLAARYPQHVRHLQWVLYSTAQDPSRITLVHSLKYLMSIWSSDCTASSQCIAPPSKKLLADRELRKILSRVGQLQKALKANGGDPATLKPLEDIGNTRQYSRFF